MIKYILCKVKKSERGATLVEFAVLIPVLLILLAGILEFGWVFNGWIVITGAAREGARVAATDKNPANVKTAVLEHTSSFFQDVDVYLDGTLIVDGNNGNNGGGNPGQGNQGGGNQGGGNNNDNDNGGNDNDIVLSGGPVQVKVEGKLSPLVGLFIGDNFPIGASATMRLEYLN